VLSTFAMLRYGCTVIFTFIITFSRDCLET
jgi:hypothetical protein